MQPLRLVLVLLLVTTHAHAVWFFGGPVIDPVKTGTAAVGVAKDTASLAKEEAELMAQIQSGETLSQTSKAKEEEASFWGGLTKAFATIDTDEASAARSKEKISEAQIAARIKGAHKSADTEYLKDNVESLQLLEALRKDTIALRQATQSSETVSEQTGVWAQQEANKAQALTFLEIEKGKVATITVLEDIDRQKRQAATRLRIAIGNLGQQ